MSMEDALFRNHNEENGKDPPLEKSNELLNDRQDNLFEELFKDILPIPYKSADSVLTDIAENLLREIIAIYII